MPSIDDVFDSDTTGCLREGIAHLRAAVLLREELLAADELAPGCTNPIENLERIGRLLRAAMNACGVALDESIASDHSIHVEERARATKKIAVARGEPKN